MGEWRRLAPDPMFCWLIQPPLDPKGRDTMKKSGLAAGLLSAAAIGAAIAASHAQTSLPHGDSRAGAVVFERCMGCHQVGPDAEMGIGPVLTGVVGRAAAKAPGFSYSASLENAGLIWNEATLTDFLRAPSARVPGTKMPFAGLAKSQDIADVIAFLKTTDPRDQ